MSRNTLSGQGLKILWPSHGGNPSVYHLMGKLFQRGFAPAQCLLESLDRNRKTELVAPSKAVRDGPGDIEYFDGITLKNITVFRGL